MKINVYDYRINVLSLTFMFSDIETRKKRIYSNRNKKKTITKDLKMGNGLPTRTYAYIAHNMYFYDPIESIICESDGGWPFMCLYKIIMILFKSFCHACLLKQDIETPIERSFAHAFMCVWN